MKAIIEYKEWQKMPMVALNYEGGDKRSHPLTFGIEKAKLLLAALEQEPDFLKKFVEENTVS